MIGPLASERIATRGSRAEFARRFATRLGWAAFGVALVVIFHAGKPLVPPPSPLEAATLGVAGDCEVLFIGSSFIGLQVLPAEFDAAAERAGAPLRSCKYGQVGLYGYELRYRLERLLAHDWPRLRLVVVDIYRQDLPTPQLNWWKERTVEWHTVAVIPWVLRRYWNDPRSWLEKLPEVRVALQHVALHYAQVGEGLERLREVAEALGIASQGGAPALDRPPPPKWLSERPRRPRSRSERLGRGRRKLQRDGVLASSAWLLEMREVVRATGREAVFVFPPAYQPRPLPKRALEGDDRLRVLDYLDPQRYPALYQASARGFTSHLNPRGAAIWSRMLARDLSPVPSPPH